MKNTVKKESLSKEMRQKAEQKAKKQGRLLVTNCKGNARIQTLQETFTQTYGLAYSSVETRNNLIFVKCLIFHRTLFVFVHLQLEFPQLSNASYLFPWKCKHRQTFVNHKYNSVLC